VDGGGTTGSGGSHSHSRVMPDFSAALPGRGKENTPTRSDPGKGTGTPPFPARVPANWPRADEAWPSRSPSTQECSTPEPPVAIAGGVREAKESRPEAAEGGDREDPELTRLRVEREDLMASGMYEVSHPIIRELTRLIEEKGGSESGLFTVSDPSAVQTSLD
jgi:hypothetical protein